MNLKGIFFLLGGLAFGVVMGSLIILGGQSQNRTPGQTGNRQLPPTVGSRAPDFRLDLLGGEEQALSEYAGTPVVVNFWATWCPPCKEEMPLLNAYADKYQDRLVIAGVNYDEDDATVQQYVTEQGITFPILMDRGGRVANQYYVRNYPTTFFVDEEGILRAMHIGLLTEDLLDRYLATIGLTP